MVRSYPGLEIGLLKRPDGYQVELRFDDSESEPEQRVPLRADCGIHPAKLLPLENDPDAYGRELGSQLFQDAEILNEFREIRTAVERGSSGLRIQLRLHDPDLQSLRWELLRDPVAGDCLTLSETVLFSRFVSDASWRPIRPSPKRQLRAVIAVSAPSDMKEFALAPVDRDGEIKKAAASLETCDVAIADEPLTMSRLRALLSTDVDILYLVSHFALANGRPILYLQEESGETKPTTASELAAAMAELHRVPRLAVLASCEGAAPATAAPSEDGSSSSKRTCLPAQRGRSFRGSDVESSGDERDRFDVDAALL